MTAGGLLEQMIRRSGEMRAAGLDWRSRGLPGMGGWQYLQVQPAAEPDMGVVFRDDTAAVRRDVELSSGIEGAAKRNFAIVA